MIHSTVRMWWRLLVLACLLSSFAANSASSEQHLEPLSHFPQRTLTILTPDARQHVFRTWVADTDARREQGLMFVQSLDHDRGMLFLFSPPQVVTMWMKNTLIPLDMVFIDDSGRVTRVIENAKPMSLDILSSQGKVSAVLELAGGVARERGIREGALISTAR